MQLPGSSITRLFAFWGFVVVAVMGCAASGDSDMQKTINALIIAGISAIFIFILVLVALFVSWIKLPPSYRGALVGCAFGLVIAAVIIRRIPLETQLVAIGAMIGVGIDFVAALKDPEGPKTAVDRVATMIAGMITGVEKAANETGLRPLRVQVVSGGLWSFLGTILFTLVVGNLF